MNNILEKLGVSEINYGACIGGDRWMESNDSGIIESINPTDNKLLAKVNKCNENDYELRLKLIEKIRREKAEGGVTERMRKLKQDLDNACAPSLTHSPTNTPACIELTQAYEIAQRGEAEREYQEERCEY